MGGRFGCGVVIITGLGLSRRLRSITWPETILLDRVIVEVIKGILSMRGTIWAFKDQRSMMKQNKNLFNGLLALAK